MRPSQLDYLRFALSHWATSRMECHEAQVALAYYVKNLFTIVGLDSMEICDQLRRLVGSEDDYYEALLAVSEDPMPAKPSLHMLQEAFVTEGRDPTNFAIRAHRHDESPGWADRSLPTSLIGPWIFYGRLE